MKATTLIALLLLGFVMSAVGQTAPDPGKPDIVDMDSLTVKPGESFVMAIRITADDTTVLNNKRWAGIGSFCIPLKYDARAFRIDSVTFMGTASQWDECFVNQKIDTGFVSLAGIHNISGKDNPALLSPDKPEQIAKVFGRVLKDAKAGVYDFTWTRDPIQGDGYLGSIDGVNGWKPKFIPGKITVK